MSATIDVQVQQRRLDDFLAAEGQQLAREPRGTRASLLNFRNVSLARIVRIEIRQQQLAEPENHGQQIVEVVGHAAGQPSDGFHLLRLLILLLQCVAFGDVQGDADGAHGLAVLAEEHTARAAQPSHGAVRANRAVQYREIAARLHRLSNRREHGLPIVGMDALDKRLEGSTKCSGLQAVLRFEDLGPLHRLGRAVHVPDSDCGALQRKPHALFRRSQGLNGLIPFGDVGAGTERADDVPCVIAQTALVRHSIEAFLA